MTAVSASPTQLNQTGGPAGSLPRQPARDDHGHGDELHRPDDRPAHQGRRAGRATPRSTTRSSRTRGSSASRRPRSRTARSTSSRASRAGGTTPTGLKWVPTSFGIRLTNARTGCTVDLPNVLIYNPIETRPAALPSRSHGRIGADDGHALRGVQPGDLRRRRAGSRTTPSLMNGPPGLTATPATLDRCTVASRSRGLRRSRASGPGQASTVYTGTLSVDRRLAGDRRRVPLGSDHRDGPECVPFTASARATTLDG